MLHSTISATVRLQDPRKRPCQAEVVGQDSNEGERHFACSFFCTIRKESLNDPLLGSGSAAINLQGEIWVRESIKSTEQSCLNDSSYFMISKTSPFPFFAKIELIWVQDINASASLHSHKYTYDAILLNLFLYLLYFLVNPPLNFQPHSNSSEPSLALLICVD